jgi:hydrogenase expression/formation protein HypC
MCLAVPARIVSIEGSLGVIDLEGVRREVSLMLVPDAQVGQYALVHAGFAITVLDEEEARKGLETFEEYKRVAEREEAAAEEAAG